jgi:hypothetical protein
VTVLVGLGLLAAVAYLVQEVRRWAAHADDSAALSTLVVAVHLVWWLLKSVALLWRVAYRSARKEVQSWSTPH